MNATEQKNYLIAAFVSLIIHFLILIIYLPGIPAPQEPAIEEIPVSLLEFSSGSKSRQISVALNTPGKGQPHQGETKLKSPIKPDQPPNGAAKLPKAAVVVSATPEKRAENPGASKENPELKSAAKPDQLPEDPTALPKKEAVAANGNPEPKPENQNASRGNNLEMTGSGDSGSGKPPSFGTGEALVKIVGPMPTYPSAALKEGKEGEVAVRVLVNTVGQLDLVIVTKSSGDLRLDYAATSSIERKWKFTSINEGYYIDLILSFDIQIGTSVKFLAAKTRS